MTLAVQEQCLFHFIFTLLSPVPSDELWLQFFVEEVSISLLPSVCWKGLCSASSINTLIKKYFLYYLSMNTRNHDTSWAVWIIHGEQVNKTQPARPHLNTYQYISVIILKSIGEIVICILHWHQLINCFQLIKWYL